jgi:hypothetical protein
MGTWGEANKKKEKTEKQETKPQATAFYSLAQATAFYSPE